MGTGRAGDKVAPQDRFLGNGFIFKRRGVEYWLKTSDRWDPDFYLVLPGIELVSIPFDTRNRLGA